MRTREQFDIEVNIRQLWLIVKRRWPIIFVGGILGGALGGIPPLFNTPIYRSGGTLQLVPQQSISFVGLSDEGGLINPTSALSNPLATEMLVIQSRPILEKVAEKVNITDATGQPLTAGAIGQRLAVEMLPQTDVIKLVFESERPADTAEVVNALIEVYIDNNINTNRQQAKATREFIGEQLPKVEADLQEVEFALRRFKEANNITSIDQEAIVISQTISTLEGQVIAREQELASANVRLDFLNRELGLTPDQAITANAVSQSAGVQEAYRALQQLEQEIETQRARFTDQSPVILNLKDRQQRLEELLAERVQVVTNQTLSNYDWIEAGTQEQTLRASIVDNSLASIAAQRALDTINTSLTSYRRRAEELPRLEQQQRELERKHQAARTTYETLLAGLQEAQVRENQEVGNVRVISSAEVPVMPSNSASLISLELIAGGILGGFLGLSISILLELLDRSLRTEYEARRFFNQFPVIGTIPAWYPQDWPVAEEGDYQDINYNLPLLGSIPSTDSPLYAVTVAYRRLQTNLKLINREQKARILAVTSSIPGEGKSVTAANLAISLSMLSHRVLLLEADLAAPQQHEIWRLTNVWGLGNVLQEQIISEQAIQSITPNLDIMSAGIVTPGLVALLDSERMEMLVRRMSEVYDYVIVDSPALLVAPEMLSLSKLTDGVLLVLRPGVLNKADAAAAQETVRQTDLNILGLIVNGVSSIPLKLPQPDVPMVQEPMVTVEDEMVETGVDDLDADQQTVVNQDQSTIAEGRLKPHLSQSSRIHQADTAADLIEEDEATRIEDEDDRETALEAADEYDHLFASRDYEHEATTMDMDNDERDTQVESEENGKQETERKQSWLSTVTQTWRE
jgi:capsular exopolysaccharide synthesis family protein